MDGFEVGGLPLHPLLVHGVVVLLPLTALAAVLAVFWPAARRRLGIVMPLGALLVLVLVPITVLAGESLEQTVGAVPSVRAHEALGRMLLPWAIALFVATAAQWGWFRFGEPRVELRRTRTIVAVALGALVLAVAAGSVVLVVLIGDSGARSVWGSITGG